MRVIQESVKPQLPQQYSSLAGLNQANRDQVAPTINQITRRPSVVSTELPIGHQSIQRTDSRIGAAPQAPLQAPSQQQIPIQRPIQQQQHQPSAQPQYQPRQILQQVLPGSNIFEIHLNFKLTNFKFSVIRNENGFCWMALKVEFCCEQQKLIQVFFNFSHHCNSSSSNNNRSISSRNSSNFSKLLGHW